jgi:hypothetical protein
MQNGAQMANPRPTPLLFSYRAQTGEKTVQITRICLVQNLPPLPPVHCHTLRAYLHQCARRMGAAFSSRLTSACSINAASIRTNGKSVMSTTTRCRAKRSDRRAKAEPTISAMDAQSKPR